MKACEKTPTAQTTGVNVHTKAVLALDVAVGKNGMVGATLLELPLVEATSFFPVGPPSQDSRRKPLLCRRPRLQMLLRRYLVVVLKGEAQEGNGEVVEIQGDE